MSLSSMIRSGIRPPIKATVELASSTRANRAEREREVADATAETAATIATRQPAKAKASGPRALPWDTVIAAVWGDPPANTAPANRAEIAASWERAIARACGGVRK